MRAHTIGAGEQPRACVPFRAARRLWLDTCRRRGTTCPLGA